MNHSYMITKNRYIKRFPENLKCTRQLAQKSMAKLCFRVLFSNFHMNSISVTNKDMATPKGCVLFDNFLPSLFLPHVPIVI